MYKCNLCDLETKQLNSLMTKHWKKHCSDVYTKEQYKIDILAANGRPQKLCQICSQPTVIPKGERDYPLYCKQCYIAKLSMQTGQFNNNWIGGKIEVTCAHCGDKRFSYLTQSEGENSFCSTSCSTIFYSLSENQSPAMKARYAQAGKQFKKLWKNPSFRIKQAASLVEQGKRKRSKKEEICFELIKSIFPDTIPTYLVKYYTFDMFIPSKNLHRSALESI